MSQTVPDSRFRRFWSNCPITLLVVALVIGLHAGVRLAITPENDRAAAFRQWGLLEVQHSPEHRELSGPFDLWAGQWWRIPLGGLHHAGWWHLGFACLAFAYLGRCLEPQLSKAAYGLFLLGALLVTTLPRWLGGQSVPVWFMGSDPAIGLSGVVYAQFGSLLVLRRNDRELAGRFGEGAILTGLVFGLASLGFSLVIPANRGLDNLAHLAGLPYGLLWGVVLSASALPRRILTVALSAAHLVLWPVFEGLIHPDGNARYHWWLAENAIDPTEKLSHYQAALELDPGLEAVWLQLAESTAETQGPKDAWRILVRGLKEHPDLENVVPISQRIWQALPANEDREQAWLFAQRELSGQSFDWKDRLLSPQQSARFLMEQGEPLEAWQSLMQHLKTLSPPFISAETPVPHQAEVDFAKGIWQMLEPGGEQAIALEILDQELGPLRRTWHLAVIPCRDLISHYHDQGELLWAWEAVIEELRADPAFRDEGKSIARQIWEALPTELRRERARNLVDDVFGTEKLSWQIELDILSEATRERYRLDQAVPLPDSGFENRANPSSGGILPIDPDDPESAALGISL